MWQHHDDHGQPPCRFNARGRWERDLAEMLGLVRGVLADGVVTDQEARVLLGWVRSHPDISTTWPINVVHRRLQDIFADGVVTEDERRDLAELLEMLGGHGAGVIGDIPVAATLPLDDPPPKVRFPDNLFVLTGRFAFGPRKACEEATVTLGGVVGPRVTHQTNYLVIGTFASRDWLETSFGRKILKAVKYRDERGRPAIVSEDHWAEQL